MLGRTEEHALILCRAAQEEYMAEDIFDVGSKVVNIFFITQILCL